MAWQEREEEWDNLQDVMRLVGHISMWWSKIDLQLVHLIANLLDIAPAQALVFLENQLPSKKVQFARKLVAIESPSGEWKKRAEAVFNKVSSELGPARNRYVHDVFHFEKRSVARAKVAEVASKAEPEFQCVSFSDLEGWCENAIDVWEELNWLTQALVPWLFDKRTET